MTDKDKDKKPRDDGQGTQPKRPDDAPPPQPLGDEEGGGVPHDPKDPNNPGPPKP